MGKKGSRSSRQSTVLFILSLTTFPGKRGLLVSVIVILTLSHYIPCYIFRFQLGDLGLVSLSNRFEVTLLAVDARGRTTFWFGISVQTSRCIYR